MACLNVLKTITEPGITSQDASDLWSRNVFAQACPSINLALGRMPDSRWMKHQNRSKHARLIPGASICLKLGRVLLTRADFTPNQLMPTFLKHSQNWQQYMAQSQLMFNVAVCQHSALVVDNLHIHLFFLIWGISEDTALHFNQLVRHI